jgi:DNA polymerase-3 subunit gamma/tau
MELSGMPRQLADNCVLLGRDGATLRLALDPRRTALQTRAIEDKLAQALSRHFGSPVRLEIEVRGTEAETPARAIERQQAERRAQARAAFEADATVDAFRQRFGASVVAESVRPSDPES